MPRTKLSEYSTVNTDNSDIESINIAEGCAPSGINNAIRELMVHLKEFQTGASGDAFTFAGGVLISGSLNTATGAMIMSGANVIAHAAGTVSAPSIYANGDTNTGIFFPAADTIAFAEGGVEAMRIDSSGQVGIGTGSPSYRLSVEQSASAAIGQNIRNVNTGSAAYAGIYFGGAASATDVFIGHVGDNNTAYGGGRSALFGTNASTPVVFTTAGSERMRIDSSGNVGIGTTSPGFRLDLSSGSGTVAKFLSTTATSLIRVDATGANTRGGGFDAYQNGVFRGRVGVSGTVAGDTSSDFAVFSEANVRFYSGGSSTEAMRIDSSGNVGIGTGSPNIYSTSFARQLTLSTTTASGYSSISLAGGSGGGGGVDFGNQTVRQTGIYSLDGSILVFYTNGTNSGTLLSERARITSGGDFLVQKTSLNNTTTGVQWGVNDYFCVTNNSSDSNDRVVMVNRQASDGVLIEFRQANTAEGNISVSGNTVSYNAFCGGHWSQLQQGRGYNPDIPRGTVMSSIGEMAEWKSVTWTETIEHPAIPAVEAKEAVLDEEGNVVEPAVEAVEGKDAWTESIPHRDDYLGNLPIGATFEEDGVTKTVVDDGNERLPKVKISDVVGDKAVYGVFQTYDGVQDMLISALGAFVVRIAAGVTVQIGDLLESNGDGCAKVQDDDVIRSKTIGKVTSTVATATYADGSYTVPCVLYCG